MWCFANVLGTLKKLLNPQFGKLMWKGGQAKGCSFKTLFFYKKGTIFIDMKDRSYGGYNEVGLS